MRASLSNFDTNSNIGIVFSQKGKCGSAFWSSSIINIPTPPGNVIRAQCACLWHSLPTSSAFRTMLLAEVNRLIYPVRHCQLWSDSNWQWPTVYHNEFHNSTMSNYIFLLATCFGQHSSDQVKWSLLDLIAKIALLN